jgi:hypothetical protein
LYLAASPGNIKARFQASGIHLFNSDIFKNEANKFFVAYLTDRSAPPVAAPASTSTSKPPEMSVNSP